jgi:LysM repeat protein
MSVAPIGVQHSALPQHAAEGQYLIRPGDTLSGIAASHGVSVAALLQANPHIHNPDLIYAGDTLSLPDHARAGAGDYVVRSGDSLWKIAQDHGVSLADLERANPQIGNPDVIYPDDVVHVPQGGSPQQPGPGQTGPTQPTTPPAGPTPSGNRVREAIDYFVGQWSRAQAAGIVANLQTESGLNPGIRGDGGLAYGIGQWHPDRQAAFQRFIGRPIQGSTFEQQLRFVQYELTHTEAGAGNRLRGAASAYDAGAIVSRYYERPADREGEAARRGQLAQQILRNNP